MDQMKRITVITTIVALMFIFATTTFADQYGDTYYQVLSTYPDEGPWSVPEAVATGENLYTFSLDFYNYWRGIPLGSTLTFHQTHENQNNTITLSFANNAITIAGEFGTQTFTRSNVPTGFLFVPFNEMLNFDLNSTTNTYVEILNNEQLTGSANEYEPAYQAGYNDAVQTLNAGRRLIITIFETPVNILQRMLNFEILGVNILGFVTGLFSLALIALIVKKVT